MFAIANVSRAAVVLLVISTITSANAFLTAIHTSKAAVSLQLAAFSLPGSPPKPVYNPTRATSCTLSMSTRGLTTVKRVAIVGAGIGGLTLANALLSKGDNTNSAACLGDTGIEQVSVYEKFDSVKPGIGGGVQINSGAVVLARLGFGEAIKVSN